jgi:hypothetical protein
MNHDQMTDLLYQSLESELGGVEVFEAALRCVQNSELREAWEKYRKQTSHHPSIGAARAEQVRSDTTRRVATATAPWAGERMGLGCAG